MRLKDQAFYGSVTVGERGQVVIPVSARKQYGIKSGDKLLVFGVPGGVAFFKAESVTRLVSKMMGRLSSIEQAVSEAGRDQDGLDREPERE